MRDLLKKTPVFLSLIMIANIHVLPGESNPAQCRVPQKAAEVIKLTNGVRGQKNLKPLQVNCQLYEAAQKHTLDMLKAKKISHKGSDNSTLATRIQRVDYQYSVVGENVASGQRSASEVVKDWMNSAGHRKNILNPEFTEIGVGYANNYWTQVFGKPR
ncbi:MAG: hypothetical protein N5P05_001062 [Chroococcopsis gigantea SAG 12.99]|jgi:uncharacterized protein YkwD|nr:hypothetical protein [Chroococcopsis gigantea SAG 12.99]